MQMSFRVTIQVGPRTKPSVDAYSTAVNKKTAKFANGEIITSTQVEKWLREQLLVALKDVENKPKVTK